MTDTNSEVHDKVRDFYRDAALNRASSEPTDGSACCEGADQACAPGDGLWGTSQYDAATLASGSQAAASLSMGCGNPYAMAELEEGETVLDLGSGAGLDVLLSAKRVGPTGKAYGVDFLPEMLEIARNNAAEAGATNVEFLEGLIEAVPLPDGVVDVVISNCVVNLAPDKAPVWAEVKRVLRSGGRVAISDVVAENGVAAPDEGEAWAECAAGAMQLDEYLAQLDQAGFTDASIEFTHQVGPGIHGATVRAAKP